MGFRKDQEMTIEADEAHKAYHLFLNPEKRAIFGDGNAIKGSSIERIEPDYHSTMGWNKTHFLDNDDWNEIKQTGVDKELKTLLGDAKHIALNVKDDSQFKLPLDVLRKSLLNAGE